MSPLAHWKIHLAYGQYGAACGKGNYSYSELRRTDDPREVTCSRCRQTLRFFSSCTGWDYETANMELQNRHDAWQVNKWKTTMIPVDQLKPRDSLPISSDVRFSHRQKEKSRMRKRSWVFSPDLIFNNLTREEAKIRSAQLTERLMKMEGIDDYFCDMGDDLEPITDMKDEEEGGSDDIEPGDNPVEMDFEHPFMNGMTP